MGPSENRLSYLEFGVYINVPPLAAAKSTTPSINLAPNSACRGRRCWSAATHVVALRAHLIGPRMDLSPIGSGELHGAFLGTRARVLLSSPSAVRVLSPVLYAFRLTLTKVIRNDWFYCLRGSRKVKCHADRGRKLPSLVVFNRFR